jgi:hypothetical protein
LKKINVLISYKLKKENFIEAVKNAYPGLPAENNLEEIANALYR